MKKKILFFTVFLLLISLTFAKEISNFKPLYLEETKTINQFEATDQFKDTKYKPELRLVGSLFTRHVTDNDIYNNNSKLIGLEYRPIKDLGVSFAYFDNSFYNDSYALTVIKYFRPFNSFEQFYIAVGAGVVKGYEKVNYIYNDDKSEVLKKAKFNTNITDDYIYGASIGIGYDITDYLSVNVSYVGAFVSLITLKIY